MSLGILMDGILYYLPHNLRNVQLCDDPGNIVESAYTLNNTRQLDKEDENKFQYYSLECYQYKLIYGLFIVSIITSFFSMLGMSIERFQTLALYRDRRKLTRKFSIAWTISSWTIAFCFLAIFLAQIGDDPQPHKKDLRFSKKDQTY